MVIENKNINRIKISKNTLVKIIKESINEILSSFPNQYEISEKCVDTIIEMLNNDENSKLIEVCIPNINFIKINFTDLFIVGQLCDISFNGGTLFISVGRNRVSKMDKYQISDVIAHELMHGNVYFQIYKSYNNEIDDEKLFDIPEYYNNLIDLLRGNVNDIAYNYAYALYSTYYQETNAITSQTYTSMKYLYNKSKKDIITTDEFIKLFLKTNSYQTFDSIIKETIPQIEILSDKQIEKYIVNEFKNYGIDCITVNFIKKSLNGMKHKSIDALSACERNSMIFFNELKNKNKIINRH